MKRIPAWVVFAVLFVVFFGLFALLRTDFPSTPNWVPGTTQAQMFRALCWMNGPVWAVMSALGAGVGTVVFTLARRSKDSGTGANES